MIQIKNYVMLVKLLPFVRRVPKSCLKFSLISDIILIKFPLMKIRKSLTLETAA